MNRLLTTTTTMPNNNPTKETLKQIVIREEDIRPLYGTYLHTEASMRDNDKEAPEEIRFLPYLNKFMGLLMKHCDSDKDYIERAMIACYDYSHAPSNFCWWVDNGHIFGTDVDEEAKLTERIDYITTFRDCVKTHEEDNDGSIEELVNMCFNPETRKFDFRQTRQCGPVSNRLFSPMMSLV